MPKIDNDLEILRVAEEIGDLVWTEVAKWKPFDKETIGKQLTRAADSIGANLVEAFGRFHFGEKLKHVYYSRGSLFETKFWINRAKTRNLINGEIADQVITRLVSLAQRINGFAKFLKQQRTKTTGVKEESVSYLSSNNAESEFDHDVFSENDVVFLASTAQ